MADRTSKHKLSTPVYKHMNGIESWGNASKDARIAFYGAMKGKAYGFEPTRSAWDWFLKGWRERPAHETTALLAAARQIVALVDRHIATPVPPGAKFAPHWRGFAVPWDYINALRNALTPLEPRETTTAPLPTPSSQSKRDGSWIDAWGACKLCDGELPYGHTSTCDLWKLEQEVASLRLRASSTKLPRLEFGPFCGCCTRNKITLGLDPGTEFSPACLPLEPADDCYIHGPGTFPHSDGCRCSKCSPVEPK